MKLRLGEEGEEEEGDPKHRQKNREDRDAIGPKEDGDERHCCANGERTHHRSVQQRGEIVPALKTKTHRPLHRSMKQVDERRMSDSIASHGERAQQRHGLGFLLLHIGRGRRHFQGQLFRQSSRKDVDRKDDQGDRLNACTDEKERSRRKCSVLTL